MSELKKQTNQKTTIAHAVCLPLDIQACLSYKYPLLVPIKLRGTLLILAPHTRGQGWGQYHFYPSIVITVRAGGWASGQAGGCQTCGTHISVTAWWIFSVRSSVELSRPVVVHCHGHLPLCPYGLAHGPKNCQICHKLGPDLADLIFLKPLDGVTPFKVSWTCLDL